jgi:proteasome activator subunit 4
LHANFDRFESAFFFCLVYFSHHDRPPLLESVRAVANAESWHVRATLPTFLSILFFRQQFMVSSSALLDALDICISLLSDCQHEVRQNSKTCLSGLLRLVSTQHVDALSSQFIAMCDVGSSSIGYAKRSRVLNPSSCSSGPSVAELRTRHAGVLGLAAIVGAHPFDVPSWMPSLLLKLASHVNDPAPIKPTVKQVFSEFWASHQDAWPLTKVVFDQDQLVELQNLLVSSSYFM